MLAAVRLALPLSKAEMTICTVPPVLVRMVTRYSLYNGIEGLLCERLLQDSERDSQSRAESLVLGGHRQAPSGRSLPKPPAHDILSKGTLRNGASSEIASGVRRCLRFS